MYPEPSPKDRAMIDAVIEVNERERKRQGWRRALTIAGISLVALVAVRLEALPSVVRAGLAVGGLIGMLGFLVFLSTKPFGRSNFSGSFWAWWFWW
jgi:hypothetical protein